MPYTADELKGAGHLLKNQMLSGDTYTFTLYRPKNQTGKSENLSGSGYFTFETVRDSNGFYPASTGRYASGTKTAISGSNTLISSPYIFSYELNTNSNTPQTSSFEFIPDVDIPVSGAYLRATGDYDMYISPETQDCGRQQQFQGGQNYPTQLQSILGSSTGTNVTISVRTGTSIPDRWVLTLGGTQVLDTGYICPSNQAGIGQPGRTNFTQSLQGRTAPEGGTYPLAPGGTAPNIIESDGYPRINTFIPDGPFPIQDNTTFTFAKNTVASVLNISVYGPQTGTFWTNTVACPV
jgi:hypothetical protein